MHTLTQLYDEPIVGQVTTVPMSNCIHYLEADNLQELQAVRHAGDFAVKSCVGDSYSSEFVFARVCSYVANVPAS